MTFPSPQEMLILACTYDKELHENMGRTIRRWMCKTEGSPTGLGKNFGRLNRWKDPLAKVIDFVPLETLFGPGAPDRSRFGSSDHTKIIESPLVLLTF